MATLEEVEAARAERRKRLQTQCDEQKAKDFAELMRLEEENPDTVYSYVEVETFAPGFPAIAVVRMPTRAEYKQHSQKSTEALLQKKSASITDASYDLGIKCTVYPAPDVLLQWEEKRAGIIAAAGTRAASLCGAKVQEEGKG